MTVTAKNLIEAKFAQNTDHTEYTAPANTHTIIDKFTATNIDTGAQTISINLVPSGGAVGASNLIIDGKSLSGGVTWDFTEMVSQILNTGDSISVLASAASKMVIRSSGREVT